MSADEDESGARDERKRDTEQQHLLLRETRHPEAADDDQKYEQVVDRQGFVGQVAGEIFDRQL